MRATSAKQTNLVPDLVAGLTTGIETTRDVLGEDAIFMADDILGDSTQTALAAARAWLDEPREESKASNEE